MPHAVRLRVYDLHSANKYVRWSGMGAFHSEVDVFDASYGFGAPPAEGQVAATQTGVYQTNHIVTQRTLALYRTVDIGTTALSQEQFGHILSRLMREWPASSYNIRTRNCTHFADALAQCLTGEPVPSWVNRLANGGGVASIFSCLLTSNAKRDEAPTGQQLQAAPAANAMPNPWAMNSAGLAQQARGTRR